MTYEGASISCNKVHMGDWLMPMEPNWFCTSSS